jgi:capsule polysaccharide export protein KpsC/LpsZ
VITITGTIGLEALLREKPVLYFGDAIFGGIKGTYGTNQIDEFIDHIIQNRIIKRDDALNDFNRFGESVFFSGMAPNSKHPASHFEATEVLFKAFLRLL